MRRALIEIEETDQINNQNDPDLVSLRPAMHWIDQLDRLGFEELVIAGTDVMQHPRWREIYDHAQNRFFDEVWIMSTGRRLGDVNRRDLMGDQIIIPIDIMNPHTQSEYGFREYTDDVQRLMSMASDFQIWQGIRDHETTSWQMTRQAADQFRGDWIPFIYTNEIPDQIQDPFPHWGWSLYHSGEDVPETIDIGRLMVEENQSFVGTATVDIEGSLISSHDQIHIESVDEFDVQSSLRSIAFQSNESSVDVDLDMNQIPDLDI